MELILIIVIAYFVIKHFKKKKAARTPEPQVAIPTAEELAAMPADLGELRKLADKIKYPNDYAVRRRICEVGIELYKQGQIVAQPGNANDARKLIDEMMYIIDHNSSDGYPSDPAFRLRLLEAGEEIIHDFNNRKQADSSVQFAYPQAFSEYSWPKLAEYYNRAEHCPRNAGEARKYLRMMMTYTTRAKKELDEDYIETLMEVIAPGQDGKNEIRKWIGIAYGLGALRIKLAQQQGKAYRVFRPQLMYQAAELLFQLDTDAIGGNDVEAMLAAYRRGAYAGNAYAQYKLGQFYKDGIHVEQDVAKGVELLSKAGEQNLALAVKAIWNYWYWLAHPFAGDYGDATKAQIAEYKKNFEYWNRRIDALQREVEHKYAPILAAGFSDGAADVPTQVEARPVVQQAAPVVKEEEEEYVGRLGQKDSDSVFTLMDFPDVMTGPHGVTYRRTSIGINTADYWSDTGDSTTLHLADLGATGRNARNSDGYFYW